MPTRSGCLQARARVFGHVIDDCSVCMCSSRGAVHVAVKLLSQRLKKTPVPGVLQKSEMVDAAGCPEVQNPCAFTHATGHSWADVVEINRQAWQGKGKSGLCLGLHSEWWIKGFYCRHCSCMTYLTRQLMHADWHTVLGKSKHAMGKRMHNEPASART